MYYPCQTQIPENAIFRNLLLDLAPEVLVLKHQILVLVLAPEVMILREKKVLFTSLPPVPQIQALVLDDWCML